MEELSVLGEFNLLPPRGLYELILTLTLNSVDDRHPTPKSLPTFSSSRAGKSVNTFITHSRDIYSKYEHKFHTKFFTHITPQFD